VELRWLGPDDAAVVHRASPLFDEPVPPGGAERYLARPGHHLALALVGDEPVGFVSGVEIAHPDKGVEMLLYELGVHDAHRRQGIGRALVSALAERAASLGCTGMWVLTDADNHAAMATYATATTGPSTHVMFSWDLPDRPPAG